jgi:hypothetical protein
MFISLHSQEELVLRRLIENVVDDLDDVDQAGADGFDAVLGLQRLRLRPKAWITSSLLRRSTVVRNSDSSVSYRPRRGGTQDVDGVDAKLFADFVGVLEDVVGWGRRRRTCTWGARAIADSSEGLWTRRRCAWRIVLHRFAEEAVALSVAVGPGGVEEVAAQIDGELERLAACLVSASLHPLIPQRPVPMSLTSSRCVQRAVFHFSCSPQISTDYFD